MYPFRWAVHRKQSVDLIHNKNTYNYNIVVLVQKVAVSSNPQTLISSHVVVMYPVPFLRGMGEGEQRALNGEDMGFEDQ